MKYTKNEDSSHTSSFLFKKVFNFLKFWKYSFTSLIQYRLCNIVTEF